MMGLSRSSGDSNRISSPPLPIIPSTSSTDSDVVEVVESSNQNNDEKAALWLVRWLLNPSFYSSSLYWKIPNKSDTCTS